jgi:NAD(P)-dependent dehydrogenase (short-subunit alcohol dehydrogenase family)
MSSKFTNKVVVITGGSSGIGKATAQAFNKEGAKIVIFSREKHKLDEELKHLKQGLGIQGDVRSIPDLDRLYQETESKLGKIDILVVNAGIAEREHLSEVTEQLFDTIVDINFKGAFFTVQRSLPYLKDGASVVLISSIAAHIAVGSHSIYSATKAAVSAMARNFSADLLDRKIRVNAISPGYIETPIWGNSDLSAPAQEVPIKRFGTPEEIASSILFLSSPDAGFIVGVDLVVDGGMVVLR